MLSRKIGANVEQMRNHLRHEYETRLVAIGFTRIKAMESVQALFEEAEESMVGGNFPASRAQTLTSLTTTVPLINFKERELTSAERNNV